MPDESSFWQGIGVAIGGAVTFVLGWLGVKGRKTRRVTQTSPSDLNGHAPGENGNGRLTARESGTVLTKLDSIDTTAKSTKAMLEKHIEDERDERERVWAIINVDRQRIVRIETRLGLDD